MSKLTKLAKGSGIMFIGMILSKFFSFFYRIYIGNELGPSDYGLLMLGTSIFFLAQKISYLSLGDGIKKYMSEDTDDTQRVSNILYSVLRISVPLSILAGIIVVLGADIIAAEFLQQQEVAPIIRVLGLSIPFGVLASPMIATFISHQKMRYVVYTNHIFQNTIKLGTAFLAITLGFGIIGVTWGFAISVALTALLTGYYVLRNIDLKYPRDTMSKKMLRFSSPLVFSGIIGFILGWTDTIMLGIMMGSTEVGVYNSALPLSKALTVIMGALGPMSFSMMSEMWSNGRIEELKDFYQTNTRWMLTFSAPAFLGFLLFPKQLILLSFGSEFTGGALALQILSAGVLTNVLVGHAGQLLKSAEQTRLVLFNNTASAVANVALNIVFIPFFGIVGAAIASATSTTIGNLAGAAEIYYKQGFLGVNKEIIPVALSSAVALIATYGVKNMYSPSSPLLKIVSGGVIIGTSYILSLIITGGIKEEDRDIIVGTGRKIGMENVAEKIADIVIRD